MTWLRPVIALALLLPLAACQPESTAPADGNAPARATGEATAAADAAAPAPPEAALGGFRVVSILLGNAVGADRLVRADRDEFAGDDTIHASVLSTGGHQGLRMSAKWLAPDGSIIADTQQALVPVKATATTFSISNPEPWPTGEYQLLISVNGQDQPVRKFHVR